MGPSVGRNYYGDLDVGLVPGAAQHWLIVAHIDPGQIGPACTTRPGPATVGAMSETASPPGPPLRDAQQPVRTVEGRAPELYLTLLKRCLTRELLGEPYQLFVTASSPGWKRRLYQVSRPWLARRGVELVARKAFDPEARANGRDWPISAETMIGTRRLDNLQECVTTVVAEAVPGDLIETGVWRGGAVIFMRAVLEALGDDERRVWVADSFRGLPRPDADQYPHDAGDTLWQFDQLAVPLEEVKANFARYRLLDHRVCFLEGWFDDTLAEAPIEQLSVLRLDGDMYQSTMTTLSALYPKLSVGGFVIVDDYGAVPGCRRAVEDYRRDHGVTDPIVAIDWTGVFWRRSA